MSELNGVEQKVNEILRELAKLRQRIMKGLAVSEQEQVQIMVSICDIEEKLLAIEDVEKVSCKQIDVLKTTKPQDPVKDLRKELEGIWTANGGTFTKPGTSRNNTQKIKIVGGENEIKAYDLVAAEAGNPIYITKGKGKGDGNTKIQVGYAEPPVLHQNAHASATGHSVVEEKLSYKTLEGDIPVGGKQLGNLRDINPDPVEDGKGIKAREAEVQKLKKNKENSAKINAWRQKNGWTPNKESDEE